MKTQINVVGAVVVADGRVLCVQRGPHGALPNMWEFPGGKIEPGETPQEALMREIDEELRCVVAVGDEITTTAHEYDFGIVNLTTFYCQVTKGTPRLTEHSQLVWCRPEKLHELDWAPADIPAIQLIQRQIASGDPTCIE